MTSTLLSLLAAAASLAGAGLAYLGARQGTRSERDAVTESQRDEWGRRFSTAIELMVHTDHRDRAMGRALLDALFDSDLATPDDRRIAQALLAASVLTDVPVAAQRDSALHPQARALDEIQFVEDDGERSSARPEEKR